MENNYKELNKYIKQITKKLVKCEEETKTLPKGTIYIRTINNKKYVYRNRKQNKKVLQEYLGRFEDQNVRQEIKKSKLYKKNVIIIKNLKKQIEQIIKESEKQVNKNKKNDLDFAININKTDSVEPSNKALTLLKLLENNIIDLQTYEFALDRLYEYKKC